MKITNLFPKVQMKTMDHVLLRNSGILQEANRRFFHPLGLALAVNLTRNENGTFTSADKLELLDMRDDPEGFIYDPAHLEENATIFAIKKASVDYLMEEKREARNEIIGDLIQQIP